MEHNYMFSNISGCGFNSDLVFLEVMEHSYIYISFTLWVVLM